MVKVAKRKGRRRSVPIAIMEIDQPYDGDDRRMADIRSTLDCAIKLIGREHREAVRKVAAIVFERAMDRVLPASAERVE